MARGAENEVICPSYATIITYLEIDRNVWVTGNEKLYLPEPQKC